jgi:UDP-glucose 4-epimerase
MDLPFHRALVTGGAGFIGSHLVDALLQEGYEVTVLDDFSSGTESNLLMGQFSRSLNIVKGDINDEELVLKTLKDIEVVFHEAAIVSVARSIREPQFVNHVNVEGTLNMLRCAVRADVERFVFASSAAVYGNPKTLPISETAEKTPISPYGAGKLASEMDCLNISKITGLETVVLRYFNAYGPRSNGGPYSGVINKFATRLLQKEAPIIFGSGKQTRDFIYVKDIVKANMLAASFSNIENNVFNVGTGFPISIEHLAEIESNLILGKNIIVPFDYKPNLPGDIDHSYADISLITKELGFHPDFKVEDGLSIYLSQLQSEETLLQKVMNA